MSTRSVQLSNLLFCADMLPYNTSHLVGGGAFGRQKQLRCSRSLQQYLRPCTARRKKSDDVPGRIQQLKSLPRLPSTQRKCAQ